MDGKAIAGVVLAVVLVVAAFFGGRVGMISREEAQQLANEAASQAQAEAEEQAAQDLAAAQEAHEQALAEANAQIAELQDSVSQLQTELQSTREQLEAAEEEAAEEEEAEEEAEPGSCNHLIDDLLIDEDVPDDTLSDRELECALFDGEVEWDGDDYEAEAVLDLDGLYLDSNWDEFGGDVCLALPEDSVFYNFELDEDLDTDEISEDEPLEFEFMGMDVEVIEWQCDEVTFFHGAKHRVEEGESLTTTVGEEEYTLYFAIITDDSVFVEVGDDSDEIDEGQSKVVGGVEVKVDAVLENEAGETQPDMAIVYIGDDVEVTVEDGDELADDSPWEYVVDCNSLGLRLAEDFDDPDDEDEPALCADSELCMGDFACILFNGLMEEDEQVVELDYDDDDDVIFAEGNFEHDIDDYEELYCDNSRWYDEDDQVVDNVVEIANTDVELRCSSDGGRPEVYFESALGDVRFERGFVGAMARIWADGGWIANFLMADNEDYISDYGMLIEDLESCVDDQKCTVHVPEEALEGSVLIYAP